MACVVICSLAVCSIVLSANPNVVLANQASQYVTTANLRLRVAPSSNAEVLKTVPEGSTVRVIGNGNGEWLRVEFNGVQGYMSSEFLVAEGNGSATFVTAYNLRMRTSPSANADVIKIVPQGSTVTAIGGGNGEWRRVEFNGVQGYMSVEFLVTEGTNGSTSFVTAYNLRMRTSPSANADVIKTVPQGSTVMVIGSGNGEWRRVEFNGTQGYMSAEFLIAESANQPLPFLALYNLRMRTSPSLNANVVTTVPQNSTVWVSDFHDGTWFSVEFNGERGYMFAEYLLAVNTTGGAPVVMGASAPQLTQPVPFLTTANLRLRAEPSLNAEVIRTVQQGSTIRVVDFRDGNWYRVEFNGSSGYMYAGHLFDTRNGTPPPASNSVELLPWSYVRTILRTGVPIQITDVRTGSTYWVSSFSNGNHADVETATAADTAAMLRTFNGTWSWATRPVLVHIGNRTIAAAIHGMPHGGGVISGNNMNGHVCIHFYGSRTHNGNRNFERDMQNAVQEAFRSAS